MIEKPSDCHVTKIKFGRIAQIAQRIYFFGFVIFTDLFLGPSLLGIYFFRYHENFWAESPCHPGDLKPLVTSQSPKKVRQPNCAASEAPEEKIERNKHGVWLLGMLPSPQFHFSFPSFSYFRTSNLGKINANVLGEILTSSAVLDHRDIHDRVHSLGSSTRIHSRSTSVHSS